jgi:hypothetical protein
MDASTRPSATRRQTPPLNKRALAAFLILLVPSILPVLAAQNPVEPSPLPAIKEVAVANGADLALSIGEVTAGEEGIFLTGLVAGPQSATAQDVRWILRNELGELVYDEIASAFQKTLPPGVYHVEARYGHAVRKQAFTLPEGRHLSASLAFSAGGLRILPALKNFPAQTLSSQTLVFALSGPDSGKLVAQSEVPGEILKLTAGKYRIENRLGSGNAVAVTDVDVRPGFLSALEVTHAGGLARFTFAGAPDARVNWEVKAEGGASVAVFEGIAQQIALKPGVYQAEAIVNGEVLTARFNIATGEERTITLGN